LIIFINVGLKIQEFDLREFGDNDNPDELTLLVNVCYKHWKELGFNYMGAGQDVEQTKKRMRGGRCFILCKAERIIATVLYHGPQKKISSHPRYFEPNTATFGQLCVHPDFQNRGLATSLIAFIETLAANDMAENITIDTAENNEYLINFYCNLGYAVVDYVNWETTNYRSAFLRKNLVLPGI
jgi:ribosomal protein S18 acetylase RimI-like enzyme